MTFFNSPRSEAERVLNTLAVILSGFYEKHGFVVLPELERGMGGEGVVILPRLDYLSIPGLYERLKTVKPEIPIKIEDVWVKKIENLIAKVPNNSSRLAGQGSELWERVKGPFLDELKHYFPKVREYVGEIEVRVTQYGTVSSGNWIPGDKNQKIYFYLREDRGIEDVASMMVNLLMHLEKEDLGITWSKREVLMDFIMTRPKMKKLFPNFKPIMNGLTRVSAKVRRESESYLRELGIPQIKADLEVVQGKVIVKGTVLGKEMSKNEKKVIKILIQRQGELVNYDELADEIWGVGEFKTFWAINKLITRVRSKLEKLAIEGKRVKAVRGQGYLLS